MRALGQEAQFDGFTRKILLFAAVTEHIPPHLWPQKLPSRKIWKNKEKNLLENAFKYCKGSVLVRVSAQNIGSGLRPPMHIIIEDDGPGMNEGERERAFERFFRGSNAANSYTEGAGLGLPVVRSIAEAHGGQAFLEERDGGGIIAIIELPKRPIQNTVL